MKILCWQFMVNRPRTYQMLPWYSEKHSKSGGGSSTFTQLLHKIRSQIARRLKLLLKFLHCANFGLGKRASGGIGRRAGFRCQCSQERGGSSPPSRTKKYGFMKALLLRGEQHLQPRAPVISRLASHSIQKAAVIAPGLSQEPVLRQIPDPRPRRAPHAR